MRAHNKLSLAILTPALLALGACSNDSVVGPDARTPAPSLARSAQATFGNLIAALNNIAVNIDELNALNDLTVGDINIINVEDLLNDNNIQALNNALNRNDVDINVLRNVLNNNECSVVAVCESLNDVLNDADIAINDVIAIDVLSGEVNVFVFPQ